MEQEQGNRMSAEAQAARNSSEFIKRAEDFARFMQKEYIEDSDKRSLLISAMDCDTIGDKTAAIHILLGDKMTGKVSLLNMMQQEKLREEMMPVFRAAEAMGDGEDLAQSIKKTKRSLRLLYGYGAFAAVVYSLLILMPAFGLGSWINSVGIAILAVYVGFSIYRDIRNIRQRLATLTFTNNERKKMHHRAAAAAMSALLGAMMQAAHGKDEDDED